VKPGTDSVCGVGGPLMVGGSRAQARAPNAHSQNRSGNVLRRRRRALFFHS
jgi:hypothetical protein